ncbi:MAG: hypothetical protein ACOCYU_05690 [Brevefilum sp.]
MVGVDQVAEAVLGALERVRGGDRYLIGDENLTWDDWGKRLLRISGKNKPVVPLNFAEIQTRKAFLTPFRHSERWVFRVELWMPPSKKPSKGAVIR